MKKIILLLAFLISLNYAQTTCKELYNSFKEVLEPQMIEYCITNQSNDVILYKFYINDVNGYSNMMLAMGKNINYMFTEYDANIPFTCSEFKWQHFEFVETILKTIFLNKNCEHDFQL